MNGDYLDRISKDVHGNPVDRVLADKLSKAMGSGREVLEDELEVEHNPLDSIAQTAAQRRANAIMRLQILAKTVKSIFNR